jgi:hypothetical protein
MVVNGNNKNKKLFIFFFFVAIFIIVLVPLFVEFDSFERETGYDEYDSY